MVKDEIKIGDKVYIDGIYFDGLDMLNKKFGIIERIMFTDDHTDFIYADVNINGRIHTISLRFLFHPEDLDSFNYPLYLTDPENTNIAQHFLDENEVIAIVGLVFNFENDGNRLIGMTWNNKIRQFKLTSIN